MIYFIYFLCFWNVNSTRVERLPRVDASAPDSRGRPRAASEWVRADTSIPQQGHWPCRETRPRGPQRTEPATRRLRPPPPGLRVEKACGSRPRPAPRPRWDQLPFPADSAPRVSGWEGTALSRCVFSRRKTLPPSCTTFFFFCSLELNTKPVITTLGLKIVASSQQPPASWKSPKRTRSITTNSFFRQSQESVKYCEAGGRAAAGSGAGLGGRSRVPGSS